MSKTAKDQPPAYVPLACTPMHLPGDLLVTAADIARTVNPANHPPVQQLAQISPLLVEAGSIAMLTKKYWGSKGVRLPVGFMDNPPNELRKRILGHMNAWAKTANVEFSESLTEPKVRISRDAGGYWSYMGTDILLIDKSKQTMNLEGFTMNTPDGEFYRVVRHETGHTLGCPHEHMREDLVALLNVDKTIEYYGATQGWTPDQVRAQLLTPLDQTSIVGTPESDRLSIMCYQVPGALTTDGKPILGGTDIDEIDYEFMGRMYPKAVTGAPTSASAATVTAEAAAGWPADWDARLAEQRGEGKPSAETHHAKSAHGHTAHDCSIHVTMHEGDQFEVPAQASEEQIRRLISALKRSER